MTTRNRVIIGLSLIALAAILFALPANFWQRAQPLPVVEPKPVLTDEVLATVRFLTRDGARDRWPSFSPDGKLIVFSRSADQEVSSHLFVVPAAGGAARPLTAAPLPVAATRPAWSKQGDQIAFIGMDARRENSLWLINADGTSPRPVKLAGLSEEVFYPSWYPDGKQLAVVATRDHVIKRIDLQQSSVVNLTDPGEIFAGKPHVSSDGEWIAFAGQKRSGQIYNKALNTIWLRGNTGDLRELSSAYGRHPTWSPDGKRLAFDSTRGPLTAVYIINRDGTGLQRVTDYALRASEPVWSPDGSQLVVLAKYQQAAGPFGLAIVDLGLNAVAPVEEAP